MLTIPPDEEITLAAALADALRAAVEGRYASGYGILLQASRRAEAAMAAEEPWGTSLAVLYDRAFVRYRSSVPADLLLPE